MVSERLRDKVVRTEVGNFVGRFEHNEAPSALQLQAADTLDALVAALEMVKATYQAHDIVSIVDIDAALALARGGR